MPLTVKKAKKTKKNSMRSREGSVEMVQKSRKNEGQLLRRVKRAEGFLKEVFRGDWTSYCSRHPVDPKA